LVVWFGGGRWLLGWLVVSRVRPQQQRAHTFADDSHEPNERTNQPHNHTTNERTDTRTSASATKQRLAWNQVSVPSRRSSGSKLLMMRDTPNS
jgi:hypothetical protein